MYKRNNLRLGVNIMIQVGVQQALQIKHKIEFIVPLGEEKRERRRRILYHNHTLLYADYVSV